MNKKLITFSIIISVLLATIFLYYFKYNLSLEIGSKLEVMDSNIEWEFFEEKFILPNQAANEFGKGVSIRKSDKLSHVKNTSLTYGTYIAKFNVPKDMLYKEWGFYIPFQYGSYDLYLDGKKIANNGNIGTSKETQFPKMSPVIGKSYLNHSETFLVLHISNFYSMRGGYLKPIYIGESSELIKNFNSNLIFHFFVSGIIFIVGLFILFIGLFNRENKLAILCGGLWLVVSLRSLYARPFIYSITIFDTSWVTATKIEAICMLLMVWIMLQICITILSNNLSRLFVITNYLVLGTQLLFILFTEPIIFQKTLVFIVIFLLLIVIYLLIRLNRRFEQLSLEQKLYIGGIFIIIVGAIHDFVIVYLIIDAPLLLQSTIVLCVIINVVALSWQHVYRFNETVRLNKKVTALNLTLDKKIIERTKELELAKNKLEVLASTDGLTGIANRYKFDVHIEQEFNQLGYRNKYLSLIMIDLDSFKKYNDYYGHICGDDLLKKLVRIIELELPEGALFARYGGEEFAVLLPNYTCDEMQNLGNKLLDVVRGAELKHACQDCGIVTVSMGGYTISIHHTLVEVNQLIDEADKLLYNAKKVGGNTFISMCDSVTVNE